MRSNVEDAVRHSLHKLTDVPPPSGLAAAALRRARRQRATRYGLAGVAGLAVVALAVPVALAARPHSGSRPATVGAPPAAQGSLVVVAYSGAAKGGPKDLGKPDDDLLPVNGMRKQSLLLNRKTGTYDTVPYGTAVPSPDGSRALVIDWAPYRPGTVPAKYGVLDRSTGQVRWLANCTAVCEHGQEYSIAWTRDSGRVLVTVGGDKGGTGQAGFAVVDAATAGYRFMPVAINYSEATAAFVWTPDEQGVAFTRSHMNGDGRNGDIVDGIQFYDLNGVPGRRLSSEGFLGAGGAFSPDGLRIATWNNGSHHNVIRILDAATAAVTGTFTIDDQTTHLIGWYDQDHVMAWDRNHGNTIVILDLAGTAIRSVTVKDVNAIVVVGRAGDTPSTADAPQF
jgi:hypothetical protein